MASLSSTNGSVAVYINCSTYEGGVFFGVLLVGLLSNIVSLLFSCIALAFLILFKRWSFLNQRLVIYLFVATIIASIATMLSRDHHNEGFCTFGGFFSHIGAWMVLNTYICVMVTLLLKIFFTINLEKLDIPIILFIFVSPLLIHWIPFIKHSYGTAGPYCWIRNIQEVNGLCELFVFGQTLQLVLWYIPLYVILSIMIIVYVIIFVKFWFNRRKWVSYNQGGNNERKQALTYTVSLLAYPVIYFTVNVFPFINRIYGLTNPLTPVPALWFLSAIMYPQQGTGIAIAFFLSIRKKLKITHIKAAAKEWHRKSKVKEYEFSDYELEKSFSGSYKEFEEKLKNYD